MRPAKIGQLTPGGNRSRPIDYSQTFNGGVIVGPPVQRAWLCGSFANVGSSNANDYGAENGQVKDGSVVAAKFTTDTVIFDAIATTTDSTTTSVIADRETANLSRGSEIPTNNDNSTDCSGNIDTHLSALASQSRDAISTNIDGHFKLDTQNQTEENRTVNKEKLFTRSKSIHEYEKINLDIIKCSTSVDTANIDRELSICNARCTTRQTRNKGLTDIPDVVNNQENSKYNFLLPGDACKTTFHWSKYQDSLLIDNQSNGSSDMNVKEPPNSCVYANFLNTGNSSSSVDEWEKESRSYYHGNNKQILSVGDFSGNKGRLSQQYFNSPAATQNHRNFSPEIPQSYRFSRNNSEIGAGPDFELQHRMSLREAESTETSFTDTHSNSQLQPTPSHSYYNKSSFLTPFIWDHNFQLTSRQQNDHQSTKIRFLTKTYSIQGDTVDPDFDLALFPKQPHLQLAAQFLSSPTGSPIHQISYHETRGQQNPDHEEQELLSHYQPTPYNRRHPHQSRGRLCSIHSVSSLIHHMRCGRHRVRASPVSFLWAFLSVLVAGTSLLTFLTPYWTVHPDHVHSFGLFNLCIRDQRFSHSRPICINFGHQHFHFSISLRLYTTGVNSSSEDVELDTGSVDIARIPSGAWQAACLLFGVGVFVQILGALVSLVVLVIREPWHHRVAVVNGYMQTVGVLLLVSGLLLYPVGFGSPFYSYYCDSSRAYRTGHCNMGWSYVTAIMTTALSIFCPVMSSFVEAHQTAGKHGVMVDTAAE